MPDELPGQLIAAYRERFAGGDDFDAQLTMMLAYWIVLRAHYWGPRTSDYQWFLSTVRQRLLRMLRSLLARPGVADLLPALTEALTALHARLAEAWADVAPMPLYPAFGGPPAKHPATAR